MRGSSTASSRSGAVRAISSTTRRGASARKCGGGKLKLEGTGTVIPGGQAGVLAGVLGPFLAFSSSFCRAGGFRFQAHIREVPRRRHGRRGPARSGMRCRLARLCNSSSDLTRSPSPIKLSQSRAAPSPRHSRTRRGRGMHSKPPSLSLLLHPAQHRGIPAAIAQQCDTAASK